MSTYKQFASTRGMPTDGNLRKAKQRLDKIRKLERLKPEEAPERVDGELFELELKNLLVNYHLGLGVLSIWPSQKKPFSCLLGGADEHAAFWRKVDALVRDTPLIICLTSYPYVQKAKVYFEERMRKYAKD